MDLGESLKTRIEAGLEAAVTKYFDRDFDGHVTVSPNGHETEIDCNIHLPSGIILQSTGKAEDPYVALDEALNKIEKRVRRYKRRLKDHHKNGQTPFPSEPASAFVLKGSAEGEDEDPADTGEDGNAPVIVAEAAAQIRTMTVSAAVLQLELADAPALMFRNAKHSGLNMVYRRADGNIGWVDPASDSKS
jgi:ribosomal subunit interface protein|tara:strand:+ start:171 stop:740 length:570 start_codon:yes stop_codon:yes gene_type:complete